MEFVLDNSVVSGWYLDDQANSYTEAIGQRLLEDRAIVPAVWGLELANVLCKACLRRVLTAFTAQDIPVHITQLPIEVNRQPVPASELLALSLRFGLSSYDASYLALALRRKIPVAACDGALRDAALASGVGAPGADGA